MYQMKERIPFLVVPGVMLIVAAFPLPYGYYTLLRLVVTVCSGVLCFAYFKNSSAWYILFGMVALLFNPLFPVHLDKVIWAVLDLVIGGTYIGLGIREIRKKPE